MSARSTRRAAEMAVVDAATAFIRARGEQTWLRLFFAVEELEKLGLEPVGRAITTNAGPETSNQAAASLDPEQLGNLARRVFDQISFIAANGGTGLTCDQVEQLLGGRHQTISARVNELRDKGYLKDSGIRRKTRSNRQAIVWQPSALVKR